MTLTQEQKDYLIKVAKLETPKQTDPNRRRDNEICYHYAAARETANSCLKGWISYEKAESRISKNLQRVGVNLKQGELENAVG